MREIKFRVYTWDTKYPDYEKKMYMLPVLAIDFEGIGEEFMGENVPHVTVPYKNGMKERSEPLEGLELMQYTGLKDKNGVEIYEGDIVKGLKYKDSSSREFVEKVRFLDGGFLPFCEAYGESSGMLYELYFPFEDVEVIGNVHENPELLEGK